LQGDFASPPAYPLPSAAPQAARCTVQSPPLCLQSSDGRWPDMGTPSQNSVIFEKYFFGQKKILKNYKNWMVL
jgi:hypothetical protein